MGERAGDRAEKEQVEFDHYNAFYEEFGDDAASPWCGDHCRRMIVEELRVACPRMDEEVRGKVVLDLGGGCTGVLRLFEGAALKIEMDPLVDRYMDAGKMSVKGTSRTILLKGYGERMPLSDGFVDVIVCRNALDHVDNPRRAADEIRRVLKPGGLLVLVVDLKGAPTPAEPNPIAGPEVIPRMFPDFIVEHQEVRAIPRYEDILARPPVTRPTFYGRLRKRDQE